MGYRAALAWLLANDDMGFLDYTDPDDANAMLTVAASMAADIYGKSDEKLKSDLVRLRLKGN